MKTLYATSVLRGATDNDLHGAIKSLATPEHVVLNELSYVDPNPWCRRNDNPRGGARGWRGLVATSEYILAANFDTLVWFSTDLKEIFQTVSHPAVANIHTVGFDGDKILGTSTINDSLFVYDGHRFELAPLVEAYSISRTISDWNPALPNPLPKFDQRRDYRYQWDADSLHVNAAIRTSDGRLIAILNHLDMLIQLEPKVSILWARNPQEQIYLNSRESRYVSRPSNERDGLSAPHDIVEYDRHLYINSSANRRLYRWSPTSRLSEVWREDLTTQDRGWLRGLHICDGIANIGTGTGSIVQVDLNTGLEIASAEVFPKTQNGLRHSIFALSATA